MSDPETFGFHPSYVRKPTVTPVNPDEFEFAPGYVRGAKPTSPVANQPPSEQSWLGLAGAGLTSVANAATNVAGTAKNIYNLPSTLAESYIVYSAPPKERAAAAEKLAQANAALAAPPTTALGKISAYSDNLGYLPSSETLKNIISPYLYKPKTPLEERIASGLETGLTWAGGAPGSLASKGIRAAVGTGLGYGAEGLKQKLETEKNPNAGWIPPAMTIAGILAGETVGAAGKNLFGSTGSSRNLIREAFDADVRNGRIDPSKIPQDANIFEIAPQGSNLRRLAERSSLKASEFPDELTQFNLKAGTAEKLDDLRSNLRDKMEKIVGHPVGDPASLKQAVEAADAHEVNAAYTLSHTHPTAQAIDRNIFGQFGDFPNVRKAEKLVQDSLASDPRAANIVVPKPAQAGQRGWTEATDRGWVEHPEIPATPEQPGNLAYWDRVYRQLRDTGSMHSDIPVTQTSIENNKYAAQAIKDALDQQTTVNGKSLFAQARGRAKEAFDSSDAIETGEKAYSKFGKSPAENQALDQAYQSQTDAQKQLAQYGYVNAMHQEMATPQGLSNIAKKFTRDENFQNRARMVLGEDNFNQLRGNVISADIKNKAKPLNIPANPPESTGFMENIKNSGVASAMGAMIVPTGAALYGILMDAAVANNLFNAGALGLVGAGIGATTKMISDANVKTTANKVLNLLARSTPEDLKNLSVITQKDPIAAAFINRLNGVLQAQNTPQPSERQGRARGGKVGKSPSDLSKKLMILAEQTKKAQGKSTEPMLNLDDTTIAKALAVANRRI